MFGKQWLSQKDIETDSGDFVGVSNHVLGDLEEFK
jgi:hypothetical protein